MDHSRAIKAFEEIQARPYRIGVKPEDKAQNCFFKGIELLQRLGIMGYTVRGRVGETYWDKNIVPSEIVNLLPDDILTTHFFVEAHIDNEWRVLDPSFQPELARIGFTIGSWENGKHCFPITKLYSQEESLAYQEKWFDPAYQDDFFGRGGACWKALDAWFAELANETVKE